MRKCQKTLSQPSRIFTDQGLKAFFRVSNVGTLPWCTSRQAMRRLASRRAKRDGAQTLRTQLQPPDPTQKTVPAPIGTVFFARRTRNSRLPIARNVAGIRATRTSRYAPAPREINPISPSSPKRRVRYRKEKSWTVDRPIVHAMRSGQLPPPEFISSARSTAPSAPLSRHNQYAKQRKAQGTCCVVRSKQRGQRI